MSVSPKPMPRTMKRSLPVLLLAAWALAGPVFAQANPSATAALPARLIALEKGTWDAVRNHDVKAFAAVCLDDCVEIYGDGSVLSIKEVLAQVPDTGLSECKFEDFTVSFPIPQTALVRYRVWARTSYKGQETRPQWMLATAVWVEKDGDWKAAFYQETPAPKK